MIDALLFDLFGQNRVFVKLDIEVRTKSYSKTASLYFWLLICMKSLFQIFGCSKCINGEEYRVLHN